MSALLDESTPGSEATKDYYQIKGHGFTASRAAMVPPASLEGRKSAHHRLLDVLNSERRDLEERLVSCYCWFPKADISIH